MSYLLSASPKDYNSTVSTSSVFLLLAKVVQERAPILQEKMAYMPLLSRTSGTILLAKTFQVLFGRDGTVPSVVLLWPTA